MDSEDHQPAETPSLSRRQLTGLGLGVGGAAVGGWLLRDVVRILTEDPIDNPPAEIATITFVPDATDVRDQAQQAAPVDEPPIVYAEPIDRSVEVVGVHQASTPECYDTIVDDISYDAATETLEIVIDQTSNATWRERIFGRDCTDELAHRPYYLKLVFDDAIPDLITIVEHHSGETVESNLRL